MKIQILAISKIPYLPYVYGVLRSYIEDEEPELSQRISWGEPLFLLESAEQLLEKIDMDTDILGLSCYMWNFNRQMKVAKLHKERNPNCKIIVGGYQVPEDSQMLMNFWLEYPFVDIVVHGEGEITFAEILKNELNVKGMPGVSTKTWFGGAVGPKLPKEIHIKSPYTSGYYDDIVSKLNSEGTEYWALWETNRGCPYACRFCEWGSALMNKVRRFDIERVMGEIEWFGQKQVKNLFMADANFGLLPRDVDITNKLVKTKTEYNSPCQIKTTFAKRSNDRVFNISKSLSDSELIYGTTLSMQSMDADVLKAIDRQNIGTNDYQSLQKKYKEAGILTYTELILGLPNETKASFIEGICSLLENGNHDDINVWELMMLPNAPMINDVEKYGLKSIKKNLFPELPNVPMDEVETKDVVIQTNTMSFDDWVDSYVFAILIQTLHCGFYTRWISHFLHKKGISYQDFYSDVLEISKEPNSVLGNALEKIRKVLRQYAEKQTTTLWMKVDRQYGPRRCLPHDWLWLEMNKDIHALYHQLDCGILSLERYQDIAEHLDCIWDDLIRFNKFMILHPSNKDGTPASLLFNWKEYFEESNQLEFKPSEYTYHDTHTGINNRYRINYDDGAEFARAAIGDGFFISRFRHYIHRNIRENNFG